MLDTVFNLLQRHEHTPVPVASVWMLSYFTVHTLPSFPPLCFWCFSEGCGECECSDVPFCNIFLFLRTFAQCFIKSSRQTGEGARLYSLRKIRTLPFLKRRWWRDVVCTAGLPVFKQLARVVIAAGEEGFTAAVLKEQTYIQWSDQLTADEAHSFKRTISFTEYTVYIPDPLSL